MPEPGPGQILVKIAATGVCHTDLHAAEGDWPVKPPRRSSRPRGRRPRRRRSGAGVTHVKEGDRVGIAWL